MADLTVQQLYHHSVAAVSWGDHGLDAYGIGSEGNLHQYWKNASNTDWKNLGGNCISPPVVIAPESGNMSVFVLGTDRAAWVKWYDGNTWFPSDTSWTSLGGRFSSSLEAISWDPHGVHLMGRDDDNSYLHAYADTRNGYDILNWENLGGNFTSEPVAISMRTHVSPYQIHTPEKVSRLQTNQTLWLFGRDADERYSRKSWDGRWTGWSSMGGWLFGAPSIVKTSDTTFTIFGIDRLGALNHRYFEEFGWITKWRTEDGSLLSTRRMQGSSFPGTDRYELFAVDTNNVLSPKVWTGANWGHWVEHFGPFKSAPAVVSWNGNRVDIFGLNADDNLVHQAWDGVKRSPSLTSGENLGGWFQTFD